VIVEITTYSPQAHIEVCTIIRIYNSEIVENGLGAGESYGNFIIDTPEESMESLLLLDGIEIIWED
jgi:hypothetical protein